MNPKTCRLCGSALFANPMLLLEGMPKAAQYYPGEDEFASDRGISLEVFQCSSCGLTQLNLAPVSYYKEVITAASLSEKSRVARLSEMKKFVARIDLAGKTVVEIGCGEGAMLDLLAEVGMHAVGIEAGQASVAVGLAHGRRMVQGFIGDMGQVPHAPFDAFVSLNYLEHLPDPDQAIKNIYAMTTPGAAGYVTVPNLEYLLQNRCHYEFVADHLSYFTQKTLTFTFERGGFKVLECYTINNDNDIVAIVQKRQCADIRSHYVDVENLIAELQQIVANYKDRGMRVAVWGAGHRTLALLSLSHLSAIAYVVDSAKFKQGRYTPVLHHKIVAPDHLKTDPVDLVLVMVPGLYPGEVLKTLAQMGVAAQVALLRDNKIEFITK